MMTKSAIRNPQSAIAFTLVELLVVVSIIALLVGILLPALSGVRKEAANVQTAARIVDLSGGCDMYYKTNGYYPGQMYTDELGSNSGGKSTGSQWLARSLFSDPDATPVYPNSKYALVKAADDLLDPADSDGYHAISDRNKTAREAMPILYYPARPGISGVAQYKVGDNSDYTTSEHTGSTSFADFIKNDSHGQSNTPYNPGAFLLIAAGRDGLYFTSDDLCYPAFKSD